MPVPEAPFPGRALRVALTARWSQRGGEKRDSGSRVQIFPSSDAKHVVERPNKVFTLPTCPAAAGWCSRTLAARPSLRERLPQAHGNDQIQAPGRPRERRGHRYRARLDIAASQSYLK